MKENFTLNPKIAVIGLGYVGLPLALEFSKKFNVVGFDIKQERIDELLQFKDSTHEISSESLRDAKNIVFSSKEEDISSSDLYVVTVPTPINKDKKPDFGPLESASILVGKFMKEGNVVIYESTVYPGATEEICVPILENTSSLKFNTNFYVGYSPERINPGDKDHTVSSIIKVTSGSTPKCAEYVDFIYRSIIEAGTHKASSIRVAEAAKVIENTQRDINIGLVNELAVIFNKLNIDTEEVLEAAGTKWNFLPFRPGLVGGHCIGVDPYYLTHKAEMIGYNPELILAARRLNDQMGNYVSTNLIEQMSRKNIQVEESAILILGVTFKENCPDMRNSKVLDVIEGLMRRGAEVFCYDPWVDESNVDDFLKSKLISEPKKEFYDAILLTVGHEQFKMFSSEQIRSYGKEKHIIYDLKYVLPKDSSDLRL